MGKRGGKRGGGRRNDWDENNGLDDSANQSSPNPAGKRGKKSKRGDNHQGFSTGAFGVLGGENGSLNQSDTASPDTSCVPDQVNGGFPESNFSRGDHNGFDAPNPTGEGFGNSNSGFGSGFAHDEDPTFGRSRNVSVSSSRSQHQMGSQFGQDTGDHGFDDDRRSFGSNRSARSRQPSVSSRHEEDVNGFESQAHSHQFMRSTNSISMSANCDNFGAFVQNAGGGGFDEKDEAGDGFNDHQFAIRSVQNDEKFANHRLSKLSISTNADEFVLVGGHPPVSDGRGSVMSNRSAASRRSMMRSTDFLAAQESNDWPGSSHSHSRQSLKSAVHNGDFGDSDVHSANEHSDPVSMYSCEENIDIAMRASPDYVTARETLHTSSHSSRSRTNSISRKSSLDRHSNGHVFGDENDNQDFGGSQAQFDGGFDAPSRTASRTSVHSNAQGFGEENQPSNFGGSQNQFGSEVHVSRAASRASIHSNAQGFGEEPEKNSFGGSKAQFGGSQSQFGGGFDAPSRTASRTSVHSNAQGFGEENQPSNFGGSQNQFGSEVHVSRAASRASIHSNAQGFGEEPEKNSFGGSKAQFGGSQSQFGGGFDAPSRTASRTSVHSNAQGFGEENQPSNFGGSQNQFGSEVHVSRAASRASIHSNAQGFGEEPEKNSFGGSKAQFGGSQSQFGGGFDAPSRTASRTSVHSNAQGFGDENQPSNFGGSQNQFGSEVHVSRAASRASIHSNAQGFGEEPEKNSFGGSKAQFGGSQSQFGGGFDAPSRTASRTSVHSNAQGFGEENQPSNFGGSQNQFGSEVHVSRAASRASIHSNAQGFGEEPEKNSFGGSKAQFGGSQSQFGGGFDAPSRTASRTSVHSNAQGFGEENQPSNFGGSQNQFGSEVHVSRAASRASIHSNAQGFGEEPEKNSFGGSQAQFGGSQSQFGGGFDAPSRTASRTSVHSNAQGFGEENQPSNFGGSQNQFGSEVHVSRAASRASIHSNAQGFGEEPEKNSFGGSKAQFGGSQSQFGGGFDAPSRTASRTSVHSNAQGFGEENQPSNFGGSQNQFGSEVHVSRAASRASIHSNAQGFGEEPEKNSFGGSKAQFGGSQSQFGGGFDAPSRTASRTSVHSNAQGFGEENQPSNFGGSQNQFGSEVHVSRAASRASIHSNAQGFGEEPEKNSFGGSQAQFGGSQSQFGGGFDAPSRTASRTSVLSNAQGFGEENQPSNFGGSQNQFGSEVHVSRAASRASIHSNAQAFGEEPEKNSFGGSKAQFGGSQSQFGGGFDAPSRTASRTSVHSNAQGFGEEKQPSNFGGSQNQFGSEVHVSRAASRASIHSNAQGFGEEPEKNSFGGSQAQFGGSQSQFGGGFDAPSRTASRTSVHSNAQGFGEENQPSNFGGSQNQFGSEVHVSRAASRASIHSNAQAFGEEPEKNSFGGSKAQFGGSQSQFGGGFDAPSRTASRTSVHSNAQGFGEEKQPSNFGGSQNQFGSEVHVSRAASRASIHSNAQGFGEEPEKNSFGGSQAQFGGSQSQFGGGFDAPSRTASRTSVHSNAQGFGEENQPSNFGGSQNQFGSEVHVSRAASRASIHSNAQGFGEEPEKNSFGGSKAQFGGSQSQFGGGFDASSRTASRTSVHSNVQGFGEEKQSSNFGGSQNQFGSAVHVSRAASRASIHSNAQGFGEEPEKNSFGGSKAQFGGSQSQFGGGFDAPSRTASRTSVHSNVQGFGEEKQSSNFGGSQNQFGSEVHVSRAASRASINSGLGDDTDDNLHLAKLNSQLESHLDLCAGMGSRQPSRISINQEQMGGRATSRISMIEDQDRSRSRSVNRQSSSANVSQLEGNPKEAMSRQVPAKPPRSRSVSISSNRSDHNHGGVGFSNMPELYSHPDEKFDRDEPGVPFRPTKEHEQTPPPPMARSRSGAQLQSTTECDSLTQDVPIPRARSISQSSRASIGTSQPAMLSRDPSLHSQTDVVPPAIVITDAMTPRAPRHTAVMPNAFASPAVFDQTQFDRGDFEARKESQAQHQSHQQHTERKKCAEIAIQTGETIRLRQLPTFEKSASSAETILPGVTYYHTTTTNEQQSQPQSDARMAQFGKQNSNSFEKRGHPAASVLTSMLQSRVSNSNGNVSSSSTIPISIQSASVHQSTAVHKLHQDPLEISVPFNGPPPLPTGKKSMSQQENQGDDRHRQQQLFNEQQQQKIQQMSMMHRYETRTHQQWSSNTRTSWDTEKVDVNSNNITSYSSGAPAPNSLEPRQQNANHHQQQANQFVSQQPPGPKQVIPKEATEEMRQQVLAESRPPLTPKSSRSACKDDSNASRVSVRENTSINSNAQYKWRMGVSNSQPQQERQSTLDRLSTASNSSQYRWSVQDPRADRSLETREPDARWTENIVKEPGRTVRKNVRPGKIRDLASMFNQIQDKASKEEAVLVKKSQTPLKNNTLRSDASSRQRRQSEPSLNESVRDEEQDFRDDIVIDRISSNVSSPSYRQQMEANNSRHYQEMMYENELQPARDVHQYGEKWQYENGLDDAFIDIQVDCDREMRSDIGHPHLRRTSTPLNSMVNDHDHMAAQFHRVPSIRREEPNTRHGRSMERGGVRALAANFERSASMSRQSSPPISRRSSSVNARSQQYSRIQKDTNSTSNGQSFTDYRETGHGQSQLSRQNSTRSKRSASVQPSMKRRSDLPGDEEPAYAQVMRKTSSPMIFRRPSTLSQQRQGSMFADIAEENVNGHIDSLFGFVEEHDVDTDVGGYAELDRPLVPRKPLNYSVSGYREIQNRHQRALRTVRQESQQQPRFSPTAAPNVGDLTQTSRRSAQGFVPSMTGHRMSHPAGFATSTPRGSPTAARMDLGDTSFVSSITEGSQRDVGFVDYKRQLDKLHHQIEICGEQIGMMQKVLTQSRKEKKPLQELSAQRTLLVARERVSLLQREMDRIKALSQVRRPPPPLNRDLKGSMVIANMTVMLNKNFAHGYNDMQSSYAFVVVLKCGSEVEATAPVTLLAHRQNRLRQLHFAEKVNFGNLPVDFTIQLEVYAMVLPENKTDDVSCASTIANKCRSILIPARRPVRTVNGLPVGEFVRCGYLQLNRDTTSSTTFYLDEAEYPLEGTIEVHSRCTTLPSSIEVDYRGFLTMFQTVSGMSSWERYWAVLRRGSIYFWKYPDDESMQRPPKAHLDLTSCTRDQLVPCTPEQCPRPYTFAVDLLVATAPSVMDRKRIMLSADSRELQTAWLEALNETLSIIRG